MPEKVDQHDPVDTAVRVVADRDERTVRQLFKPFASDHLVFYPDVLQDSPCEVRTRKSRVHVIKVIHLVNRQNLHKHSAEGVAGRPSEYRGGLFKFIYAQKGHGCILYGFSSLGHAKISPFR